MRFAPGLTMLPSGSHARPARAREEAATNVVQVTRPLVAALAGLRGGTSVRALLAAMILVASTVLPAIAAGPTAVLFPKATPATHE